jgi:hypothetical protein
MSTSSALSSATPRPRAAPRRGEEDAAAAALLRARLAYVLARVGGVFNSAAANIALLQVRRATYAAGAAARQPGAPRRAGRRPARANRARGAPLAVHPGARAAAPPLPPPPPRHFDGDGRRAAARLAPSGAPLTAAAARRAAPRPRQVWLPDGCPAATPKDALQAEYRADPELAIMADARFAGFHSARCGSSRGGLGAALGLGRAPRAPGVPGVPARGPRGRAAAAAQTGAPWRRRRKAPARALLTPSPAARPPPHRPSRRSAACHDCGRLSMPGRVFRSGCVQVVQNLRVLPACLHPRSRLGDDLAESIGEALYLVGGVGGRFRPFGAPRRAAWCHKA